MIRAVLVALLAAACSPPAPERKTAEPPAAEQPAPAAAPAPPFLPADATPVVDTGSIIGEWRVAGVAGQALSQPFGISASIDRQRIVMTSDCIIFEWRYTLDDGAIALFDDPTRSVCERMHTEDERRVHEAMESATRVYRLPSNALVFDGPAGAVTLFTQ